MSYNVFFLPDNLAPYQIARFNALAKLSLEFEVVLVSTQQHYRPWKGGENIVGYKVSSFSSYGEVQNYLCKLQNETVIKNIIVCSKQFLQSSILRSFS